MTIRKTTKISGVTEQVEAAVEASKETVEAAVKATTDATAKGYEKAVEMTQEHVEAAVKAGTEAFQGYEDVVAFNKDNVNAVVRSSTLWVQGIQDLNKAAFALTQTSVQENIEAAKAIMGCKTVTDLVKLQSEFAKASYDKAMTEGRKFSDMSSKVAEKATKPLGERAQATFDTITKQVAA